VHRRVLACPFSSCLRCPQLAPWTKAQHAHTAWAHCTSWAATTRPCARPSVSMRSRPFLFVRRPLVALIMLSFAALAPSSFSAPITSRVSSRSTVSMTADVSRRALLTTAAGAMFMPLAAQADGANSAATQLRARGIYGSRIFALQVRPTDYPHPPSMDPSPPPSPPTLLPHTATCTCTCTTCTCTT
jgi:hypothetical protein